MARYPCEMFAHVYYSPALTYEELHAIEEELLQRLDVMLGGEGAIHLEFWPDSDSLAVQGEFEEFEPGLLHHLAERVRAILPASAEARMVFVNKLSLEDIIIYNITPAQVEETATALPRPFAE